MSEHKNTENLDDLLADVHRMLDEDDGPVAPRDPFALDFYDEEPELEPEPVVNEREKLFWTQTQRLPKHVAKLQNNQAKAYADWLYAQGSNQPAPPVGKRPKPQPELEEQPKKKKRHGFRNFLLFLLVLLLLAAAVIGLLLPRQPIAAEGLGTRKDGVSTILLAGADQGGMRTDTLMLLSLDSKARTLSLISIPRDTLVNGSYQVPKINSVYGANNGGQVGMDMLLQRVGECIGFRPDGCVLIQLEAFEALVDTMGGVEFNVPVDMYYNDPAQDLYIDLVAGPQTLTGEEAMGVARFRSGYADADLGRVSVQRALLAALIQQTVSPEGAAKAPALLDILLEHTESTLDITHYLWFAKGALLADKTHIQTVTLPGSARTMFGGSYYVLDPTLVAETVNAYCNPYEKDVTADDLKIRQG